MRISRRAAIVGATTLVASPPLLTSRLADAQAIVAPDPGPPFHRFEVGEVKVTVVTDGTSLAPDLTRGVVANATPDQVAEAMRAAGLPGTAFRRPFNTTVVETRAGLVLFDVGTGGMANTDTGALQANLRLAGIDASRIVRIVHTHFHPDHIGGLTRADGTPAFPGADVWVPEGEWRFWTDAGEESRSPTLYQGMFGNVRRRFAAYEPRLTRFAPGAEVAPGIIAIATPGHSPAHSSFMIADGNAQALLIGDAVNIPFFFVTNPDWQLGFDMDKPLAVETRRRLLDQAATERMPVVGYHFPMPATGRIERAGTGYRLVPSNA